MPAASIVTDTGLGDLTRFDTARQLVGFLGLPPSERSSGSRRRQGAIGNGHVRRILVESAWAYRFPAQKTAHLRRKAAGVAREVWTCPAFTDG